MSPVAEQILALVTQSIALQQQGQLEAALACLNEAVALAPDFPVTRVKRGTLLLTLGRPRAALADFDRSLARQALPHVLPLRDTALQGAMQELQGRLSDAPSCCEYAVLLERLMRNAEAEAQYRNAIELDAHSHPGWIGLGNLLLRSNRHAEALACYEAVLVFAPGDVVALFNRGNALQKDCRFTEAIASYMAAEQGLEVKEIRAEIKMEQAHCHLAMGHWQTGWPLFEARWQTRQMQGAKLQTTAPQWQGEMLPQASLLLWAEQGLGDTLQFVRYLPIVAERVGRILLRVPASLLGLLAGMAAQMPAITVLAQDEALPLHELHCPLMSLPLALGSTPQSVPQNVPYLRVPGDYVEKWKDALGPYTGPPHTPRIAIVWSGGQRRLNNPTRDMPLTALLPLLEAIDAQWLSLQKDVSDADAVLLAQHPQIRRMDQGLNDFADTAAILAQVDLLISVDTAVAHLAGAMGKPVWLALRKAGEWRWMQEAAASPWYPGHRLFRQSSHGQWVDPVQEMRQALCSLSMEWAKRQ